MIKRQNNNKGITWDSQVTGTVVQNLPANAGGTCLIPDWGGPWRRKGQLQYSCLGNSTDRGACQATLHGVEKSWTWLSSHTRYNIYYSISAQAGIKIAGRSINNLRYADDTTLEAEIEEELKSLLMKVKEESEKVGLNSTTRKLRTWHLVPSLCGK